MSTQDAAAAARLFLTQFRGLVEFAKQVEELGNIDNRRHELESGVRKAAEETNRRGEELAKLQWKLDDANTQLVAVRDEITRSRRDFAEEVERARNAAEEDAAAAVRAAHEQAAAIVREAAAPRDALVEERERLAAERDELTAKVEMLRTELQDLKGRLNV